MTLFWKTAGAPSPRGSRHLRQSGAQRRHLLAQTAQLGPDTPTPSPNEILRSCRSLILHFGLPMGLILGIALGAPAQAEDAAAADPFNAALTLTLAAALPGAKDLQVHLRLKEDRVLDAFATAPDYNGVSHTISDVQVQRADRDSAQFNLAFTVHPDAWLPADRSSLLGRALVSLRRTDGQWVGSYTGKLAELDLAGAASLSSAVRLQAQAQPVNDALIEIRLDSLPLAEVKKQSQKQAFVMLALRDGKVVSGSLKPYGSSSYSTWSGYPSDLDLTLTNHVLSGRFTLYARKGDHAPLPIAIELEGTAIGDVIAGTVRYTLPAETAPSAPQRFRGEIDTRSVTTQDAVVILSLDGAIDSRAMLRAFLQVTDGVVVQGFGFSPTYNRAVHTVDVSQLRISQGKLTGTLPAVIAADPVVPQDGKAQAYTYELDVPLSGRIGIGRFEAKQDGQARQPGVVTAQLDAPSPPRGTPRLWLKFEDGLVGGAAWQNRAFASFRTDAQGKASAGDFSTNKRVWQGEFIEAEVTLTASSLTGYLSARVTSGSVRAGSYRFDLDAKRVGDIIAGSVTTRIDDQAVKTSSLLGAISDGESDQLPEAMK